MARRGLQTVKEARIAVAGADPRAALPQPLRQALTTWTGVAPLNSSGLTRGERRKTTSCSPRSIEWRDPVTPTRTRAGEMGQALAEAGAARRLPVRNRRDARLQPAVRASAAESLGESREHGSHDSSSADGTGGTDGSGGESGRLEGLRSRQYRRPAPCGAARYPENRNCRRIARFESPRCRRGSIWSCRRAAKSDALVRDPTSVSAPARWT